MEIFMAPRRAGKTHYAIETAIANNAYIIVANMSEQERLRDQAELMGHFGLRVYTIAEVIAHKTIGIKESNAVVDNLDNVLREIIPGYGSVKLITLDRGHTRLKVNNPQE